MKNIIYVKGKKVVLQGTPDKNGFVHTKVNNVSIIGHPRKGVFVETK